MNRILTCLTIFTLSINVTMAQKDVLKNKVVPSFMLLSGIAMTTIWTKDIISNPDSDKSQGLLRARDKVEGRLMIPHWIAEYGTSGLLIAGAIGQYQGKDWGYNLSLLGLGALAYTSMNSLSWSLAKPERKKYAYPMFFSIIGSGFSIIILL